MFLEDLAKATESMTVGSARDFVAALITLNPGDRTLVEKFMSAARGAADFISARNSVFLEKASSVSGLIDKREIMEIYKNLDEDNRNVSWKYVSKLYSLGKKSCPELVEEGDFDFNSLRTSSPVHEIVQASKKNGKVGDGGLIGTAFQQICINYLKALSNIESAKERCALLIELVEKDGSSQNLISLFETNYDKNGGQSLVMNAEGTLEEYGLPMIGKDVYKEASSSENWDEIVSSAMQLGTLYSTLTCMDRKTIMKMESMAKKFCTKVESGELAIDQDNLDPMSIMSSLMSTGLSDEIMELFAGI
jgi:hypothetical protein